MSTMKISLWVLVFGLVLFFQTSVFGAQSGAGKAPPPAKPAPVSAPVLETVPGPQPEPADEGQAYLLGPEDVLEVSVWRDQELTKEVVVQPDGYFSFPLMGQVLARGRSVARIEKELRERLAQYVSDPVVTVLLRKVQSYKVYVVGKVNRPGEFSPGRTVNVMQALSMAAGMTPYASSGKILILRQEGKEQIKIPFDYDDVAKGKNLAQNCELKTGDVVVVP